LETLREKQKAQDKAMSTNYFKSNILKEEISGISPLCQQHEETMDYLTAGCPILANNEYLIRQNKVGAHVHYSICKAPGNEMTDKWYTHKPKPVRAQTEKLQQICQI
jgi:hypothetical protein